MFSSVSAFNPSTSPSSGFSRGQWHGAGLGRNHSIAPAFGNIGINPTLLAAPRFFTQKIAAYVQQHAPTTPIMLTIGMPDGEPPEAFQKAIAEKSSVPGAYQYAAMPFTPALSQAVSQWLAHRFNVQIESNQILPYAGTNEGLYKLIHDVLAPDKGDLIWTPAPYYPTFKTAQTFSDWQPLWASLNEENNYAFDFEKAWKTLPPDKRQHIKAIILNYPNNPTGAVARRDYLQRTLAFAKSHNLLVMNDMAYADVYYPGGSPPASLFEFPEAEDANLIEFHSLSKGFCLPGARIGMAVFSKPLLKPQGNQPKSLYQAALENRANHHATGILPLLQHAAVAMLQQPKALETYLEANRQRYAKRAKFMADSLTHLGWQVIGHPGQTSPFYLWVKVPDTSLTSDEFVEKMIRETGVAMIPGSCFGPEGEGYLRIAMTQPMATLKKAIQRLKSKGFDYSQ